MEHLFTYKEFVSMMKNYGIKHKNRKLKCAENILTNSTEPNSVILLLNGYIIVTYVSHLKNFYLFLNQVPFDVIPY